MRITLFAAMFVAVAEALALGFSVPAVSASRAGVDWLPGSELSKSLAGKTIEGHYANGRAFTEHYLDDGRVEYREGGNTAGGRWSITAGTLCTIYDNDPSGGCFHVARAGPNCFEFYFASRTEELAPGPEHGPEDVERGWTARGSVSKEPNGCRDNASV